ncbi:MAG: DUF2147 domain-containing protein [Gammaproteobacteria bacterium]|nr:DUF2147 domain-containing protein [Gammaproteobacteria bacterium]
MRRLTLLFLVTAILLPVTGVAKEPEVFGKWKTIDDVTGEARSVVELYALNGKLFAKVVRFFPGPGENLDPRCEKCEGDNKNQKILGMVIINGLVKKGTVWADGTILDPDSGTVYACKLWLENGKLSVRGYVSFFYRTQTWLPLEKE